MKLGRFGQLVVERVSLGVEGDSVARPLHVDIVGVVDEVERRDREEHPRDSEPQVHAGEEQRERGACEIARQAPLVVLAPDDQRAPLGGQGDDAGEQHGVHGEVHDRGAEGGQHLAHEAAARRREGQIDEAGGERRDDVVGHVEDDLHGIAHEPRAGQAGYSRHHQGGPEPQSDQRRKDRDERERDDADEWHLDLAQVGQSGQDHEGDEVDRERRRIAQQGRGDGARGSQRQQAHKQRDGRALAHGRLECQSRGRWTAALADPRAASSTCTWPTRTPSTCTSSTCTSSTRLRSTCTSSTCTSSTCTWSTCTSSTRTSAKRAVPICCSHRS